MKKEKAVDILLVEDNQSDIFLIKEAFDQGKILNNLNFVRDGIQAMDYLQKKPPYSDAPTPDLIILDLNMPRMNGREVLAEIKKDDRLKSIPVVIMTTSDDEQDVIESYKLHANCYICKPVDFSQFTKIVKNIQSFWFNIVTLP